MTAVAERFFRCLDAHDVCGALSLAAPEAEVELVPVAVRGRDGARHYLENLICSFPDLRVVVRHCWAASDGTVVAEVTVEGTQGADFVGILNREKHFDLDQAWVFEVIAGQLLSIRAYWCQNQFYRRLGVRRPDRHEFAGSRP